MTTAERKQFMQTEVAQLLAQLPTDRIPNFGLMTPQHMVEHLVMVMKSSVKRYGEPANPPTKGQIGFKTFVENGAVMKHRPSNKTVADLPALKYASLEEALQQIPVAIERFYTHYDKQPDFLSCNPFWGELGFDYLEVLHYMHYRYHLWQFNLIESYP